MNPQPNQIEESDKRWTGCFVISLILYSIISIAITVLTFLAVKLTFDITSDLMTGSCLYNYPLAGCDDVNSTPSVLIDNWGQVNSTDMKVCVLRSQETWLQVAQQSGPNCTSNNSSLKQCGFSPNNIFCTSEAECPINNVQIVNLTLPSQSALLANCTAQNNCTILSQSLTLLRSFIIKEATHLMLFPLHR